MIDAKIQLEASELSLRYANSLINALHMQIVAIQQARDAYKSLADSLEEKFQAASKEASSELADMIEARNEQMFLADSLVASVKKLESILRALLAQHNGGGLITEEHWALVREAVKGEEK